MTVRIPRGLTFAVEEFLWTEAAAKMEYDSKADVVTAAVRKLLTDYNYYPIPRRRGKVKLP
mgnify:CR=1 FL=1